MSGFGRALAVLGAAAGGYVKGDQMLQQDERDKQDREIRLADANWNARQRAKADSLDVSLANAARPVTVDAGAGGMIRPDTMDNRDVGQPDTLDQPNGGLMLSSYRVGAKPYASAAEAQTAADAANAPAAVSLRLADAYRGAGKPTEALTLQNAQLSQDRGQFTFTKEQQERARQLQEEGAFDTAKATRTGDAQAVFDTFNKAGKTKLLAVPTVTEKMLDLPGIGKVKTYDYTGQITGPDGQPKDFKINSHDFSMNTLPYEKMLDTQRKGTDSDNKAAYQTSMIDLKIKQLEAAGQVAEAKALAAAARASSGGGALGREERLRYTSLFTEAGRRQGEATKALSALQRDPVFMTQASKAGSPQAEQMAQMQADIKAHADERSMYQGLLAGSQGTPGAAPAAAPAPAAGKPGAAAAPAAMPSPTTQAEKDKLPKGTQYRAPDGTVRIKG